MAKSLRLFALLKEKLKMRFTDDDLHAVWDSKVSMFDYVSQQALRMGFTYCSYGLRYPVPVAQPKFLIAHNYPEAWRTRFESENYLAVDPTIAHGLRSDKFLLWSPEVFQNAPDMWDDANAHGLNVGWAKASRRNGSIGMLSLSREADPLSALEIATHSAAMERLSDMLLLGIIRDNVARDAPETAALLTEREKEVLRWTADGKTSCEIGLILSISGATVNFHLNKTLAKLNSVNKTQAVVKAVILGLL